LDHVTELRDRYERYFVDCISAGVKSGEFRKVDPRLIVKPFLGALSWTVFWYRPPESKPGSADNRIADELAEFVMRALIA
jgi:hypothetical protein